MFQLRLLRALWRSASVWDRLASIVVAAYVLTRVALAFVAGTRPAAVSLGVSIFALLFYISLIFLVVRSRRWIQYRLLWSLRNRLILAYILIAVVPVVLLLAMGGILFYMGDMEVAAHLLADDVNTRMHQVAAISRQALALVEANEKTKSMTGAALEQEAAVRALESTAGVHLPGLTIRFSASSATAQARARNGATGEVAFGSAHFVAQGDKLYIESTAQAEISPGQSIEAIVRLPVTPRLLNSMSPELGPINFLWGFSQTGAGTPGLQPVTTGTTVNLSGTSAGQVSTQGRELQPRMNLLDFRVNGMTTFPAFHLDKAGKAAGPTQVLAVFSVRPSSLTERLRSSMGMFSMLYFVVLVIVSGLFLVLGLLGLIAGIVLTRTITNTVNQLDEATHFVKARDFSHRISIARHDQLGALAESFNSMTASIEELLEQQRQRQRLENELAIAREVQTELFPRSLPVVPGLQLAAVCRAARIVSGDYYDCLQLDANRAAMAVADISGKGISAALLMASLNAALRSLIAGDGFVRLDTDAVTERLNRHLLLNTSDDRYATFFFSVYDAPSRTLRYTNAGHLPPLFVTGTRVEKLDQGGPVIGLLDNCSYEQASIEVQPGSLLVVYSDGITEPENEYGEEFGTERLIGEVLRHRNATPETLCSEIIDAVKSWCAPAEPFDDQTVLVARME